MANNSIGFIETWGLTSCIAAADAAVKSANVKLIGYEYAKGGGLCTVKVEGNVGACKAAIVAGKRAAESVRGTHQGTKSILLKARPADGIMDVMVKHRENVGGEQALAEGYRPKGESRMPVLVKNWKPKAEAVVEEPIAEAPVTSEVEDLKDEAEESTESDEDESSEQDSIQEETPVEEEPTAEEVVEEPVAKETPVEEKTEAVVAPEEISEVVAPAEEAPETAVEPVAEEPKTEEPVVAETEAEESAPAQKPKKSTSGTRRSGRSRKKKTDK